MKSLKLLICKVLYKNEKEKPAEKPNGGDMENEKKSGKIERNIWLTIDL